LGFHVIKTDFLSILGILFRAQRTAMVVRFFFPGFQDKITLSNNQSITFTDQLVHVASIYACKTIIRIRVGWRLKTHSTKNTSNTFLFIILFKRKEQCFLLFSHRRVFKNGHNSYPKMSVPHFSIWVMLIHNTCSKCQE
jgi:hypothetical protein